MRDKESANLDGIPSFELTAGWFVRLKGCWRYRNAGFCKPAGMKAGEAWRRARCPSGDLHKHSVAIALLGTLTVLGREKNDLGRRRDRCAAWKIDLCDNIDLLACSDAYAVADFQCL